MHKVGVGKDVQVSVVTQVLYSFAQTDPEP